MSDYFSMLGFKVAIGHGGKEESIELGRGPFIGFIETLGRL